MTTHAAVRGLTDRLAVHDALYRYASTIDLRDFEGLRSVLADDVGAQYGNADPIVGADALVHSIEGRWQPLAFQHHFVIVYSVHIESDRAKAVVYHTSHQVPASRPRTARVLVGRYHNELVRMPDGWKISRLVLELLWGEHREDSAGYLASVGGRGPQI